MEKDASWKDPSAGKAKRLIGLIGPDDNDSYEEYTNDNDQIILEVISTTTEEREKSMRIQQELDKNKIKTFATDPNSGLVYIVPKATQTLGSFIHSLEQSVNKEGESLGMVNELMFEIGATIRNLNQLGYSFQNNRNLLEAVSITIATNIDKNFFISLVPPYNYQEYDSMPSLLDTFRLASQLLDRFSPDTFDVLMDSLIKGAEQIEG